MPHPKQGWAVMECTYEFVFTETYEHRYKPVQHQRPVHEFKTEKRMEISRQNYYAPCKKGQTGDDYLSRWLRQVARPEAEGGQMGYWEGGAKEQQKGKAVGRRFADRNDKAELTTTTRI